MCIAQTSCIAVPIYACAVQRKYDACDFYPAPSTNQSKGALAVIWPISYRMVPNMLWNKWRPKFVHFRFTVLFVSVRFDCTDKICRFFVWNSSRHNSWTIRSNWMQFSPNKAHIFSQTENAFGVDGEHANLTLFSSIYTWYKMSACAGGVKLSNLFAYPRARR